METLKAVDALAAVEYFSVSTYDVLSQAEHVTVHLVDSRFRRTLTGVLPNNTMMDGVWPLSLCTT